MRTLELFLSKSSSRQRVTSRQNARRRYGRNALPLKPPQNKKTGNYAQKARVWNTSFGVPNSGPVSGLEHQSQRHPKRRRDQPAGERRADIQPSVAHLAAP